MNNLLAFGVSAAVVDGLKSDDTAADAPWQVVALDLVGIALYAAAVLWLARRHPPTRTVPAPAPTPVPVPVPVPPPWHFPGPHPQAHAAHVPVSWAPVPVPAPYADRTDAPGLPPGAASCTPPPPGDTGLPPR